MTTEQDVRQIARELYEIGSVYVRITGISMIEAKLEAFANRIRSTGPQAVDRGDAEDAARYRWLRASVSNPAYAAHSCEWGPAIIYGIALDKTIDAALTAHPTTKEGSKP